MELIKSRQDKLDRIAEFTQKWELTQQEVNTASKAMEKEAYIPPPTSKLTRNLIKLRSEQEMELADIMAADLDRTASPDSDFITDQLDLMRYTLKVRSDLNVKAIMRVYILNLEGVDARDFKRTVDKFLSGKVGGGWFPVPADFLPELAREKHARRDAYCKLRYSIGCYHGEFKKNGKYNRFSGE